MEFFDLQTNKLTNSVNGNEWEEMVGLHPLAIMKTTHKLLMKRNLKELISVVDGIAAFYKEGIRTMEPDLSHREQYRTAFINMGVDIETENKERTRNYLIHILSKEKNPGHHLKVLSDLGVLSTIFKIYLGEEANSLSDQKMDELTA